jgi:ceramide glucosyltransferase
MTFALALALALWTVAVAVTSLWALCEPAVRPLVRWALAKIRPRQRLARIEGTLVDVLLVRPCAGFDPSLDDNLRSLRAAGREGLRVRCVLALGDEQDAATRSAQEAAAWLSAHEIECEVRFTHAEGPNHKADQLARVIANSRASVIVVADSDVDLSAVDLRALVEPLCEGEAAACWVPVAEKGTSEALGDRASLAILAGGLHGFSLLARLDPAGMVGKLFSVRRDALENVGGFSSMLRYLGEDVELSRRLRAAGGAVLALPLRAYSTASGRTLAGARDRYARWLLVVRSQRPALLASYPLLFFAAPVQIALGAMCVSLHTTFAASVMIVAALARMIVAAGARRAAGLRFSLRATTLDPWLGDLVLCAAWLRALRLREVRWRRGVLRFDREGLLESVR